MIRSQVLTTIWLGAITAGLVTLALKPSPSSGLLGAVIPTTFSAGTITATTVLKAAELTITGNSGMGGTGSACSVGSNCASGLCANAACVGGIGDGGLDATDGGSDAGDGGDATVDSGSDAGDGGTDAGDASDSGIDAGPQGDGAVPLSRLTVWQPGVTYNGGIPARATNCATLSPQTDGGDQTGQINSALSSCTTGETVSLAAGTYNISGQGITIPANVTLRGQIDATGRPSSKLVKLDGASQPYSAVSMGNRYASLKFIQTPSGGDPATGGILLTSDAVKETNHLTLASNPGLSVGDIVYLDMAYDSSLTWWNPARSPGGGQSADPSRGWFSIYDRPIAQVMEISGISGTTITFTTGFHISFTVADGAAIWQLQQPATKRAGIENVYVFGGTGGDGGGGIHMFSCAYCWAKNVEVDHTGGTGVNIDDSFRCELRDSYIHHAGPWSGPSPGGDAYLTGINAGTADSLFENNVVWNGNKVVVMRASGGGNVVAYNYMQDAWGSTYPSQPEVGVNASHMTTPHYEEFEGNWSFAYGSDPVWGNSIDITVLRNNFTGLRTGGIDAGAETLPLFSYSYPVTSTCNLFYEDVQGRLVVGLTENSNNFSFVGNVLGYSGEAPVTQRSGNCIGGATAGFAYEADGGNGGYIPIYQLDPTVDPTIIRVGNYDYVNNAQVWSDAGVVAIPNSYYIDAGPPFFEGGTWPWVDPTTGTATSLPAQSRWNAMLDAGTYLTPLDIAQAGW